MYHKQGKYPSSYLFIFIVLDLLYFWEYMFIDQVQSMRVEKEEIKKTGVKTNDRHYLKMYDMCSIFRL
jgi:hypothetical protein